jgi:hypothetical protein
VAISIEQLPHDANGGLDGTWLFQLRQNLNGGHGGATFQDGRTVTPVDARTFRKFVATMGQDIVGAYRQSDDHAIGDVSTLRPESFDELASKSLVEQDSNKLLADQETEARKAHSKDDAVVQHARAGAKFESPEKQARRKAFEEAAGRSVKETDEGETVSVTGEGRTPDGGKVIEGGEPALKSDVAEGTTLADTGDVKRNALVDPTRTTVDPLPRTTTDPAALPADPHADTTSTDTLAGKKKRW